MASQHPSASSDVNVERAQSSTSRSALIATVSAIERSLASAKFLPSLLLIVGLWWAQVVLIPVVLALLISYALEPLVAQLCRWRIRRAFAVPLVMFALLGLISLSAYVLQAQALSFLDRLPDAAHRISQAFVRAAHHQPGPVSRVQQAARELETAATAASASQNAPTHAMPVRIEEPTFKWTNLVWTGSRGLLELAAQMFAVLCLVYYLLAAGDMFKRKLVHIVPTLSDKKLTVQILSDIDRQIERFLLARLAISVIVGAAIWLAFRLIGLEQPGVWALLAAVLFAIPLFGPVLIVCAAGIAAFLQFDSIVSAMAVVGICTIIGALEGNLLTPWLMSRVGEMNPIAVFISLLFWGWLWGMWGLLLAVPITAAIKAVCDRIESYKAIAELLSSARSGTAPAVADPPATT